MNNLNKLTEDELNKFGTITDAYNKLVECKTTLKQASEQVKHDFRTPDDIEKGYYFSNPIEIDYDFEKIVDNVQSKITDFILRYMDQKFSNLVIDERDVHDFIEGGEVIQKMRMDKPNPKFKTETRVTPFGIEFYDVQLPQNELFTLKPNRPVLQGPFSAKAVIQYIEYKYADEETITLQQIKESASNALPRVGEYTTEKASKPEHINVVSKTGIELKGSMYYSGRKDDPTAAVIKLIHIKLNHVLPSQAEHHDINCSDTYSDDKIKSLRKYKNGKLKIIFHTVEDMEIMRITLVGCD